MPGLGRSVARGRRAIGLPASVYRERGVSAFTPLSLFAASEPGAWYDPSDLSTMFQDTAGTTPVTATGQTVGLVLDKSRGLVLGPELVANGDFSSAGTTGWVRGFGSVDGTFINSGGVATYTLGAGDTASARMVYALPGLVIGARYRVAFTPMGATGTGDRAFVWTNVSNGTGGDVLTQVLAASWSGASRSFIVTATATTMYIAVAMVSSGPIPGGTISIDNISVRELPGNHATQSVLASRPIYGVEPFGGRRNLLTYTEQFDNAAWNKITTTVTPNSDTAPDGTTTADTLAATGANSLVYQVVAGLTNSTTYTLSVWVKTAGSGATATLAFYTAGGGTTIGSQSFTTTGSWQRVTLTATTGTLSGETWFAIGGANTFTTGESLFIWGAQLEAASTATAYQRVTDQWNVTQAGVPSVAYLAFDGSDDFLVTNTITPGIDKAQVFAGVRKLSDAAVGMLAEFSFSAVTNNGAINLRAPGGVTPTYSVSSRGTIETLSSASGFAAPITNIVSVFGDISADGNIIRVNGTQAASNTSDQGTGNYLAYPLYIGRRGGTSLPYNGRIYSLIVRFGANLTADQIAQTENWVAGKTGITI